MIEMNELYDVAEELHLAGCCVIPLAEKSKRTALASWAEYQKRRADASERFEWFGDHPERNIGVVCGWVSGDGDGRSLAVLDFDEPGAYERFTRANLELVRSTWIAKTAKGHHVYLRTPGKVQTTKIAGGDLKAEGSYVVCPPSVHPDGPAYTWANKTAEIAVVDDLAALIQAETSEKKPAPDIPDRIPAGERNTTLTSLAGTMRRRGASTAEILAALRVRNRERCDPPLPDAEVAGIGKSLGRYPSAEAKDKRKRRLAMKDVILRLALAEDIKLFTDQHGWAYCRTPRDGHYEILSVDGKDLTDWLGLLLYRHGGQTCSDQTMDPARRVLRAKAKFEGRQRRLENRTAWAEDGSLYYDLTDPHWRAVRITPEGWQVDPTPPVLFRRYAHQAAQVLPEAVAIEDAAQVLANIFKFVNLAGEADQLVFTVYVTSLLIAEISHPMPVLHGEQGSGKTYTLKTVRRLIDPSDVATLTMPWQGNEFVQQLDHHWLAYYDNLARITDWQQDIICRAVTGEGHTKRKLYSDEEDIIFTYRRCIALNGINIVSTRPDLLDRSIILELSSLEGRRQTEAQLEADFERLRPRLLGAILGVLAGALNEEADTATALGVHFRLADWVAWGYRIAEALGGRGAEFVDAYAKAVKSKALTALELHPLGRAIQVFMADKDKWEGAPKELLEKLKKVAGVEGVDTDTTLWPGAANWVGRRLKEIKRDLRTAGITYDLEHDGTKRVYTFTTD